jgi:UDP-glucose 4-epimerase
LKADVRDEATVHRAMDGVDVVFHLAASVGNTRSIENPLDDSDINVLGTLRIWKQLVVTVCAKSSARRPRRSLVS